MTREQRGKYPPNWPQLATLCKERADYRCENCGIEQYAIAESRKGTWYIIYLHAAHVHHDPPNRQPELRCLCISCHARYDYAWRQREKRVELEQLKHRLLLAKKGSNLQWQN